MKCPPSCDCKGARVRLISRLDSRSPGGSDGEEPACRAGDPGSIPRWGRSPGEGNGNPLQYSCRENPTTEEPGGLHSMGGKELDATERLTLPHTFTFSSVVPLRLTLFDPMDGSTPGFPVHHQLPEIAQTHVHRVRDAIQPSHPLSSPSSPAFNSALRQIKATLALRCSTTQKLFLFNKFSNQHHDNYNQYNFPFQYKF